MRLKIILSGLMLAFLILSCSSEKAKKPKINVIQSTIQLPNETGVFDFGDAQVGSKSAEVVFTIQNLGKASLILDGSPDKIIQQCAEPRNFTIQQNSLTAKIADWGNKSGNVYVFYGSQSWSTNIPAANINIKLTGADAGDKFGVCVSSR